MELTKNIKRQIRELASFLYQRELNAELAKLDAHFEQWRQGSLSPFDLAAQIHEFHQKPARELFGKYSYDDLYPSYVAKAIADGSLSEAEVASDVKEALAQQLAFFRSKNLSGKNLKQ
jgi:hypothetical protein